MSVQLVVRVLDINLIFDRQLGDIDLVHVKVVVIVVNIGHVSVVAVVVDVGVPVQDFGVVQS